MLTAESKETGEDILEVARRRRPRIEHAQIMRQEDLRRAGKIAGKFAYCLSRKILMAARSHRKRTANPRVSKLDNNFGHVD